MLVPIFYAECGMLADLFKEHDPVKSHINLFN